MAPRLFLSLMFALHIAPAVLGHGVLVSPISRALRAASNSTDGIPFGGSCPGFACEWYTQQATIPPHQRTTICDPSLRTMGVHCSSPNDFPCTPGEAVPW